MLYMSHFGRSGRGGAECRRQSTARGQMKSRTKNVDGERAGGGRGLQRKIFSVRVNEAFRKGGVIAMDR